jgi:hypothetical protein
VRIYRARAAVSARAGIARIKIADKLALRVIRIAGIAAGD